MCNLSQFCPGSRHVQSAPLCPDSSPGLSPDVSRLSIVSWFTFSPAPSFLPKLLSFIMSLCSSNHTQLTTILSNYSSVYKPDIVFSLLPDFPVCFLALEFKRTSQFSSLFPVLSSLDFAILLLCPRFICLLLIVGLFAWILTPA